MSALQLAERRRVLRGMGASGFLGVATIIGIVGAAAVGPFLWTQDPMTMDLARPFSSPSFAHPLGTDNFGRDMLSRLLAGARFSIPAAVTVLMGSTAMGLLVGVSAGMASGLLDRALSRLTDALLALPSLVIALGIVGALGTSLPNLVLALVVTGWPWHARIYRSFVVAQRHSGYVESARAIGCAPLRIVYRHIGPNIAGQVVVVGATSLGGAVLGLASLSFLGLGLKPPAPEWGAMVNEGRLYFQTHPWIGIAPAGAIAVTVLAANLVGDALRDLNDPRSRLR